MLRMWIIVGSISSSCVCVCVCVYIYIYIYIYMLQEKERKWRRGAEEQWERRWRKKNIREVYLGWWGSCYCKEVVCSYW
jgi:hypothetical protein